MSENPEIPPKKKSSMKKSTLKKISAPMTPLKKLKVEDIPLDVEEEDEDLESALPTGFDDIFNKITSKEEPDKSKKPIEKKTTAPKTSDDDGDFDLGLPEGFEDVFKKITSKKESDKASGGTKPKGAKVGASADILDALGQLEKLSGGEEFETLELENIDEEDLDFDRFLGKLEEDEKLSPGLSKFSKADEMFSFDLDSSLPLSPMEMDEEDHSAEKKQLEKGFEKKIQDMKETQSEETKATAKTSAPKRTGFSKKASKKVKRAIALTLCVMIIFPSILLINSYDTSCSRQLLVSPHLGYLVWQDDVNTRIDPNFAPLSAEKNVDPSISLRSAKNEVEYSRFAIRSLYTDTKSVEFSISNLQLTDGSAIIAQSNIKIYNVQSALSDQIQDVLVEIEMGKKLSIETEKNAVFLIQIQTPASAVAGEYSGNFTLILDSLEFTIEIGLNVFDFSLPSLNSKTIIYGGNEIKTQSDIEKLSSVGIYSAKIPLNFTYEASTQLTTFEWTTFDSLMQSAISQGFSKIDVSIELDLPESFVVLGQEYNASYLDAYSKIAQHIKANNWITKVYVDMGHQTGSEELYASSGLIKLIKQADSDLSITFGTKLNATNIERFGLVNHWIISIKDLDSEFPLFKEMKRSGKSVLLFVDDSIQMPFLNLKLTNPLVHARLIPWLIYQFNLDGFYYFDTVNMQPNAFGYGPDGLSSGLLIYSNEEGDFHPSERFEILKQGFEDLSYLLAFRGLEESTQKTELISRINVLIARFSSVSLDSQKYIGIRNDIAQLLQA